MRSGTIAFLFGCLAFHQLPQLPAAGWWSALPALVLAVSVVHPSRPIRWLAWFSAGLLWTGFQAALLLERSLPEPYERRDLTIEGQIVSLPERQGRRLRFEFDVDTVRLGEVLVASPGRVRLSWYGEAPRMSAGQRWRLRVRLKRPHGLMNPAGFDYGTWLYTHRIRAVGYVRDGSENRLLDPGLDAPVARAREWLRQRLGAISADRRLTPLLPALAVGDRSGVDDEVWEVLRRTGTGHLMAISGLHVGLMAGLAFWIVGRLWSLSHRLAERVPAPVAGAWGGLLLAALYALLAGFSIPTRRALIMVTVALVAIVLRRRVALGHGLALALLLVLLFDPLAVLSPGFWLSFTAVGVILYAVAGRVGRQGIWWRWGRIHWVIAVGLAPLGLVFFQQTSVVAPLANSVAVPWVGLVVVPLTLLGCALLPLAEGAAEVVLQGAVLALEVMWPLLEELAGLPFASWQSPPPSTWALLSAAIGLAWILAPRGWPARALGIVGLLPLGFTAPPVPGTGEVWLTVLDVGQGLAVVVRTQRHVLVYDTGPRFRDSFDAGAAVLVPFLRSAYGGQVDGVVLSHAGADHTGGAEVLVRELAVPWILAGERWRPENIAVEPCRFGHRWEWEGVDFHILHPEAPREGNDGSCVMRVTAGGIAVLLTGDIEAGAERTLVDREGAALRSHILVAPHHGSKTSSTALFVNAVQPEAVLFSTGYLNRYGFPHRQIKERYERAGAALYDTARDGALTVRLKAGEWSIERYRQVARRYWHVTD